MVKNLPANAEETGLIPGLGGSLEEEMAIHSSILARKTMNRRAWQAIVHRIAKSQT